VAWLRLRRVRDGRVRPAHRRVAGLLLAGDRLRARCARAGDLQPVQRRHRGPGAPQRSRHPVPVDALHRPTDGGRH
jgi:hypothetical protein